MNVLTVMYSQKKRFSIRRLVIFLTITVAALAFGFGFDDDPTNAVYPDPLFTKGSVAQGVSKEEICKPGWPDAHRNVSLWTKRQVFQRYKVRYEQGFYEVDHFIPLGLGGSNDLDNLWPQPFIQTRGLSAEEKNYVEQEARRRVCVLKTMSLRAAQNAIKDDWVQLYKKFKAEQKAEQKVKGNKK